MLIDRIEETARVNTLLDQVRDGMSGALVLRGEAGIGKSAILNATVESAQDLSVIRLEGIESEMQLGYAALHRLLLPHLPRLEPSRRTRAVCGIRFHADGGITNRDAESGAVFQRARKRRNH